MPLKKRQESTEIDFLMHDAPAVAHRAVAKIVAVFCDAFFGLAFGPKNAAIQRKSVISSHYVKTHKILH